MPDAYESYKVLQSAFSDNQEYYSHGYELPQVISRVTSSPYNSCGESQGSTSTMSPMSTSSLPMHEGDCIMLNDAIVIGEPHITILEQPVEKFRFRYKSEMIGTHGSLVSASNTSGRRKHAPTVQLHNFADKAVIRCTLVTSDESQRIPHAHRLVRREGNSDRDDPHYIEVSPENGFIASFHGMGIIHTAKKHIREELIHKMRNEALAKLKRKNINATLGTLAEAQIKADAELYQKCINLNSVALCFQAFLIDQNEVLTPITKPVYSTPINNLKSALTGELKICRIDKYTSSCEGNEEVFIFVEKVGKKNIKIKFFELNEDDHEIWSDYGRFSELDVHHQYAIVFRTPPYKDQDITVPKEVFIQLERPSDGDISEPIKFTYKPSDRIKGKKRQRMSYSSSGELAQVTSTQNILPLGDSPTLYNDSHELLNSNELKTYLAGGCNSTEFTEFVNEIDLDQFAEYAQSCINDSMLASDGPREQDDTLFAKNVVMEAIQDIKMNPKNKKERLQKLLKDRSTYGDSPLHAALRYDQQDIVKYILILLSTDTDCKTLVNSQNSSGKTPLHYAVLQNQPEITKALLMLGADPNRFDDHGFSPLHAAVRLPEAGSCVDALLSEKMTNIEAHNDAGWTALQLAAEAGSYHAVKSLVQAGANVNNTDMSYGRTALHIAVEGGHKEIVRFLLKHTNIEVNKRNFSGNTALHSAVVYSGVRAKELCALLIQHGADPHLQNHNRDPENDDRSNTQNLDIKVEVDSEDENIGDTAGQSSYDLATNKPDILQLLDNQSGEISNECPISTKQEKVDDDLQETWLDSEEKGKLAAILDKSGGWEKLAKQLKFDYLISTLRQNTATPALLLLNYIDVQADISLSELESLLHRIDEMEAATYIHKILSMR